MKFTSLFIALALGAGTLAEAQISKFPAPPVLAPPSDGQPDPARQAATAPDTSDATPLSPDATAAAPSSAQATNAAPVSPLSAAKLSSMTALDDKATLQPGDMISFRVIEDRDEPVTRLVTDTGEVDFPYIGRVKVAGKTCHVVAVEVKKLLEVDYYKHATVIVGLDIIVGQDNKTKPRDLVWVVGEVKEIGPQELSKVQTTTVSQVIVRAGGFLDFADRRRVKLIHRDAAAAADAQPNLNDTKDAQQIDVQAVLDGKSRVDPVVTAGDYVVVPKKWVNF